MSAQAVKAQALSGASASSKASLPESSGETVTIACKLPHGLILRVHEMVDQREAAPGGFQTVKKARRLGRQVVIRGTAIPFGQQPSFRIEGGYALTEGVDAAFWERWLEDNRDSDVVVNNLVFASKQIGHAIGQAREQEELRSGLEPLVPSGDPRVPKSMNPNVASIEPASTK